MRKDIHPVYKQTVIKCACGAEYPTWSTKENIHIEICAACHPFFTGKQKLVDTAGRVEKFQKRVSKRKPNVRSKRVKKALKAEKKKEIKRKGKNVETKTEGK